MMKTLKHLSKRCLAVLLAVMICVGTLSLPAFAATDDTWLSHVSHPGFYWKCQSHVPDGRGGVRNHYHGWYCPNCPNGGAPHGDNPTGYEYKDDNPADGKCDWCGLGSEGQTTPVPEPSCDHSSGHTQDGECKGCGADVEHSWQSVAELKATCTTTGHTAGQECTVCGKTTVKETSVDKNNHTGIVTDSASDATCTTPGKTEGKRCTACGTTITAQQDVNDPNAHNWGGWTDDTSNHEQHYRVCANSSEHKDYADHSYGEWKTTKEATVKEAGEKSRTCSVCNHVQTETIPAPNECPCGCGKPEGNCGCVDCEGGDNCGDNCPCKFCTDDNCEHGYQQCGDKCKCTEECGCMKKPCGHPKHDQDGKCINPDCGETVDHDSNEKIPEVTGNCTQPSMSAGKKCSVCGKVTEEPKNLGIVEGAHDYPDTWTDDGETHSRVCRNNPDHVERHEHTYNDNKVEENGNGGHTWTCDDCDHTKDEGHKWDNGKCEDCGAEHKHADEDIVAIGEAKDPNCTEKGRTAGKKCSVCGKVIEAQTEIETNDDHDWGDWQDDGETQHKRVCSRDPENHTQTANHTYDDNKVEENEDGGHTWTCDDCDHTKDEGHKWDNGKCEDCDAEHNHTDEDIVAIGEAKDPNCTEKGRTAGKKCSVCGKVIEAQTEIETNDDHDWGDWQDESETQHKRVCGRNEEHVERGNHTYDDNKVKENENGGHTWTCDTCPHTKTEEHKDVTGPNGEGEPDDKCDDCGAQYYTYTLRYDLKGGNGDSDDTIVTVKTTDDSYVFELLTVDEAEEKFTRDKHDFKGWSEADTGMTLITSIDALKDDTVTVYAVWQCNEHQYSPDTGKCENDNCGERETYKYTLTYDLNGGDELILNEAETSCETTDLAHTFELTAAAKRDGYEFKGWAADKDATSEDTIEEIPANNKDTKAIVYAVWVCDGEDHVFDDDGHCTKPECDAFQYTVSYEDGNGNATEPEDIGENTVVKTPEEAGVEVPEGKVFDHWVDANNKEYKPEDKLPNAEGNIVLTPVWKNVYTLTIHYQYADGSQAAESKTIPVVEGEIYNAAPEEIQGYSAALKDGSVASGTMTGPVTVTYIYTAIEQDSGTEPENPGTEPENPGTEPENPGTEPENPGTEPENPGTEPTEPATPSTPNTPSDNTGDGDTTPTTPSTPSGDDNTGDNTGDDLTDIPEDNVPLVPGPGADGDDLTDIPEDNVPLVPGPGADGDDLTDIPEDNVPLVPGPGADGDDLTDIPEGDVPLTDAPNAGDDTNTGDDLMDIADGEVPLAAVPQTGDNSHIWSYFALISGACLVWMVLKNKKREESAE